MAILIGLVLLLVVSIPAARRNLVAVIYAIYTGWVWTSERHASAIAVWVVVTTVALTVQTRREMRK